MENVSWEIFGERAKYGHVRWKILEVSETGPIEWTLPLQEPRHREEQETWIPIRMDWGKQKNNSNFE
jgi:hypothetical protein